MSLNIIFSLDESLIEMTEEEKRFIHSRSIQFEQISTRNSRTMYSALIPSIDKIDIFKLAYAGRNPIMIGLWNISGLQFGKKYVYTYNDDGAVINTQIANDITYDEEGNQIVNPCPLNTTEYINLMPDIIECDIEGNIINTTRPTVAIEIHKFSGRADKRFD